VEESVFFGSFAIRAQENESSANLRAPFRRQGGEQAGVERDSGLRAGILLVCARGAAQGASDEAGSTAITRTTRHGLAQGHTHLPQDTDEPSATRIDACARLGWRELAGGALAALHRLDAGARRTYFARSARPPAGRCSADVRKVIAFE
jgi:hypothetical protein